MVCYHQNPIRRTLGLTDINGGMVSEVNETNGAIEVNEDKHLVHKNRFKTSKKDALKAPEKCEQVKDP